MFKTTPIITLCTLLSLASQPLLSMQAPQDKNNKTKTIVAALGITALVGGTIAYMLLTKSDKQICDQFMNEVGQELDAIQCTQSDSFTVTNVYTSNIPPLFSSEKSLNNVIVHSRDGRYRAQIEHRTTKKCGRHFHELNARYYPAKQTNEVKS